MNPLWLIFRRDLTLAWRRGGSAWNAPLFFGLCMMFFAFGMGAEALTRHASHAACIALFLSVLLSASGLFEPDLEDGVMEQYLLLPVAFELVVLAKMLAAWIGQLLPVLLLAVLAALMLAPETTQAQPMLLALLPATGALLAVASLASALTLGSRRASVAQALIALPFYLPVLIFASAAAGGQGGSAAMPMLTALCLLYVPLSCFAGAALLRMAQE